MTYTTQDLLDMGAEAISIMTHGDLYEAVVQLRDHCIVRESRLIKIANDLEKENKRLQEALENSRTREVETRKSFNALAEYARGLESDIEIMRQELVMLQQTTIDANRQTITSLKDQEQAVAAKVGI